MWKFKQKKQTKFWTRVSVPEKEKTRISNAEFLNRRINLEEKKEKFEELLETLKDQKESRKKKDDAMIAAAKSFQDVSAAIIASLNQE